MAALRWGDAFFGYGALSEEAKAVDEFFWIVFNVGEDICHAIAFDFMSVDGLAIFKVYADDVGVSKEVMEIS